MLVLGAAAWQGVTEKNNCDTLEKTVGSDSIRTLPSRCYHGQLLTPERARHPARTFISPHPSPTTHTLRAAEYECSLHRPCPAPGCLSRRVHDKGRCQWHRGLRERKQSAWRGEHGRRWEEEEDEETKGQPCLLILSTEPYDMRRRTTVSAMVRQSVVFPRTACS